MHRAVKGRPSRVLVVVAVTIALLAGFGGAYLVDQNARQVAVDTLAEDGVTHTARVLTPEEVPMDHPDGAPQAGDQLDTHPGPLDGLGVWPTADGGFLVVDPTTEELPEVVQAELVEAVRAAEAATDPAGQATILEEADAALMSATGQNLATVIATDGGWFLWSASADSQGRHITIRDFADRAEAVAHLDGLMSAHPGAYRAVTDGKTS